MKLKLFLILLVCLDQASKFLARHTLEYKINKGMIFGIVNSSAILDYMIFALIVMGIAWLFVVKKKSWNWFYTLSLIILFAALSNYIGRVFQGGVVDFIKVPLVPWFNLADVVVVCGIILLIIKIVTNEERIHHRSST